MDEERAEGDDGSTRRRGREDRTTLVGTTEVGKWSDVGLSLRFCVQTGVTRELF